MERTALPHLALTTNPTIIIKTSPRLGAHSDGPPRYASPQRAILPRWGDHRGSHTIRQNLSFDLRHNNSRHFGVSKSPQQYNLSRRALPNPVDTLSVPKQFPKCHIFNRPREKLPSPGAFNSYESRH